MTDMLELSRFLRTNFRIASTIDPPRYKRIYVPIERMKDLLLGRLSTDLPSDATVFGVGFSEDRDCLYIILYSEDWDPIDEGCMIPEYIMTWQILQD